MGSTDESGGLPSADPGDQGAGFADDDFWDGLATLFRAPDVPRVVFALAGEVHALEHSRVVLHRRGEQAVLLDTKTHQLSVN